MRIMSAEVYLALAAVWYGVVFYSIVAILHLNEPDRYPDDRQLSRLSIKATLAAMACGAMWPATAAAFVAWGIWLAVRRLRQWRRRRQDRNGWGGLL